MSHDFALFIKTGLQFQLFEPLNKFVEQIA